MAEQVSLVALHDRLDDLWSSYLDSLDSYTKAQALIQQHISAGSLSLARANFNARDGVTRYGKDFYHEKAVATKRVSIDSPSATEPPKLQFVQWTEPPIVEENNNDDGRQQHATEKISETVDGDSLPQQQPSPPATPSPDIQDDNKGETTKNEPPTESDDPSKVPRKTKPSLAADPIRWFGILVPRELRMAQTSFKAAIDAPVLDAVAAARSMRDTEVEMRKLRKGIRRAEKPQGRD